MKTADWLSALAGPKDLPEYKRQPWTVDLRGEPWTVVTNAQFLVMVPGKYGFPPAAGDWVEGFRSMESKPVLSDPIPLHLAELRQFCGLPEAPCLPPRCESCLGSGFVECPRCKGGEDDCTCPKCGSVHVAECRRCDASGEMDCPLCEGESTKRQPGLFGRSWFDRRLLGWALAPLPGDTVAWRHVDGTPTRAEISGEGWTAWIMPLRGPDDERFKEEYEDAPAFEPLAPKSAAPA